MAPAPADAKLVSLVTKQIQTTSQETDLKSNLQHREMILMLLLVVIKVIDNTYSKKRRWYSKTNLKFVLYKIHILFDRIHIQSLSNGALYKHFNKVIFIYSNTIQYHIIHTINSSVQHRC